MEQVTLPNPAQAQKARTRKWRERTARTAVMLCLLLAMLISSQPVILLAQDSDPAATPASEAEITALNAATPVRLIIPAINVDTVIESVGKTADNQMGVPQDSDNTAWYNAGPIPGESGNAVISGHLDDKVGPAVFWRLRDLEVGDTVTTVDASGQERHFAVLEVASYPYDKAPLARIFGFDIERDLNLITCAGRFNRRGGNYSQRLVVYTRLIP